VEEVVEEVKEAPKEDVKLSEGMNMFGDDSDSDDSSSGSGSS